MAKTEVTKKNTLDALPTFLWEGLDKRGKVMKGEATGRNEGIVKADLRRQGIEVRSVKPKPKPKRGGASIKPKDIAGVARQLATMLQSGVPIIQAFDIMGAGAKNPRMQRLISKLRDDISGGLSLNEALANQPAHFDELFVNLVKAGEGAGVLETILDTIATYKEKVESLKGKIKKAMFYPVAVISFSFLITAGLLMFVVPVFQEMFKGFGADLPAFTQLLVNLSNLLLSSWWMILGGLFGSIFGGLQAYKKVPKFRHSVDKVLLNMPVIGKIMHGSAIARFARTLAITFKAGVPLVEAMDTVSGATGSETYRKAVLDIKDNVSAGYSVNLSMAQTGIFPHMVVQMVAIGEESGALDTMLEKVADMYEEEVNNSVDALTSLLEPLIMVIVGVMVGSIVIGMYLPIFKMAETIG